MAVKLCIQMKREKRSEKQLTMGSQVEYNNMRIISTVSENERPVFSGGVQTTRRSSFEPLFKRGHFPYY